MRTHSTKFCFCIPVRLGVLVVAALVFLLSGIVAAAGWYNVSSNIVTDVQIKYTMWAYSIEYSILAVVALLGLFGAIFKKRALVTIFEVYLIVSLIAQIAVGVWSLIVIFRIYDAVYDAYNDDLNNKMLKPKYMKIISIVSLVVEASLILYGIIVVRRYKYQLWEDEKQKWHQHPQFEQPKEGTVQQGYSYNQNNISNPYAFTAQAVYPPVSNTLGEPRLSYYPVATTERV